MRILDPTAHAEKRGCILAAARRLFACKGFHATSMNEVAEASGLAKAAVYHYFDGKDALLRSLHDGILAGAEERIKRAPRFNGLRDALSFLGRGYLEHFKDPARADVMRIALNVSAEDPDLLRLSSSIAAPRMEALLGDFLAPYLPKGAPRGAAKELLTPFFGALFYYRFVLSGVCDPGQLPDEGHYLANLVDVFSQAGAGQKRAAPGSLKKRKPA
jgi:AcrR family transcriptional regulator